MSSAARWTSASGPIVSGGYCMTPFTSTVTFSSRPARSPYCSLLRPGEQVHDVLHPHDAPQVTVLVDDGHGALAEGPHDLDRVLDRIVLRDALRVRRQDRKSTRLNS